LLTRLQPENWSLPIKLVAVLLVPILLAFTLGAMRISDQVRSAQSLAALSRYLDLQTKASGLVEQLQRERDVAGVFVAGKGALDPATVQGSYTSVDNAEAALESAVGDASTLDGAPASAYQEAKAGLDRLAQLRTQVNAAASPPGGPAGPDADNNAPKPPPGVGAAQVVVGYTTLIQPLLAFQASLNHELEVPALGGLAGNLAPLGATREQIATEHAIIATAIARGTVLPIDVDAVRAADARLSSAIDQFKAGLDADQQARYAGFISGPAISKFQQLKQAALGKVGVRGGVGLALPDWDGAYNALLAQMGDSASGITQEVSSASSAAQADHRNRAGIDSVVLLLAMLTAAAVVYLVGRSLLRPLRLLRTTALDIAGRRLPNALEAMREGKIPDANIEPVPVTSLEEIGQVARAFDEVHGQAIKLAAEQAGLQTSVSNMFVNLSRRSQTLVERQLQLIEGLERNEQDPEQLANLFQLDHLATRMRRNSENLLVLAGSELGKRSGQQVPVVDVLRAAVSEIEQYQRVVVQPPPSVSILGRAASDLVHLVAELLDNATSYSPPDTQVVISSTRTSEGALLVEIADQGVGMPADELASYNDRLAGQSDMDVSASRRMGLFVVGRLAARHGINVRLAGADRSRGARAGLTVSVNVPSGLITEAAAEPSGQAERSGSVRRAEVEGSSSTMVGALNGAAGRTANGGPNRMFAPANGTVLPARRPPGAPPRRPAAGPPLGPGGRPLPPRGRPGGPPPMPPPGRRPGPPPPPDRNGLRPERNGMPPERDGVPPERNGMPPERNGVPPERNGAGPERNGVGTDRNGAGPEHVGVPPEHNGVGPEAVEADGAAVGSEHPAGPAQGMPVAAEPGAARTMAERRPGPPEQPGPMEQAGPVEQPGLVERSESVERPGSVEVSGPVERPGSMERSGPVDRPGSMERSGPVDRPGPVDRSGSVERPGPVDRQVAADRSGPVERPVSVERPGPVDRQVPVERSGSVERPGPVDRQVPVERSGPMERKGPMERPGPDHDGERMEPRPMPPRRDEPSARPPAGGPPPRPELTRQGAPNPPMAEPGRRPTGPRRGRPGRPTGPDESPIFEETSAWFRDNWLIEPRSMARPKRGADVPEGWPVDPADEAEQQPVAGNPPAASVDDPPVSGARPVRPPARSGPLPSRPGPPPARPMQPPVSPPLAASAASRPARPVMNGQPDGAEVAAESRSEGWSERDSLLRPMPETESAELTSAGLPKRRPRAQLIPGGPPTPAEPGTAAPARNAEQVRGRLSSYQSGVRQGRESRTRRVAETANAATAEGSGNANGKENG
jgi:signal transduction histidine kinase